MSHTTLPLTISWLLITGLTGASWAQSEDLYLRRGVRVKRGLLLRARVDREMARALVRHS